MPGVASDRPTDDCSASHMVPVIDDANGEAMPVHWLVMSVPGSDDLVRLDEFQRHDSKADVVAHESQICVRETPTAAASARVDAPLRFRAVRRSSANA